MTHVCFIAKKLDLADKRSESLSHLMFEVLPKLTFKPRYLLIENVKGFRDSEMRTKVVEALKALTYDVRELLLSPTQFGIPNQRTRYFLLAKLAPLTFEIEPFASPVLPHEDCDPSDASTVPSDRTPKCLSSLCTRCHRGTSVDSYLEHDFDDTPYLVKESLVANHGTVFRLLHQFLIIYFVCQIMLLLLLFRYREAK